MNSTDARALTALLETIEEAGGDVHDVEIDTRQVIRPDTVFARTKPTQQVFTLEITVDYEDLLGEADEATDTDVRDSCGIDIDGSGGDA